MASESRISSVVLVARDKIKDARERAHNLHLSGGSPYQVSQLLTQLSDEIILELFQWALAAFYEEQGTSLLGQVALVAHGGYGRMDLAPYSDIDLMLVHNARSVDSLTPLVRKFTNAIFDAGLQLGFSVRTINQAIEMSREDATVLTSLAEMRLLYGEEELYRLLHDRLHRETQRHRGAYLDAIHKARWEEREKYGETVYLLEPNIKRSTGGLRDVQFLRWLGYVMHGETNLETLHGLGVISDNDWSFLREAQRFLLELRNELHFHAGRSQDVLDRAEQMRIAEKRGYRDRPGMLAVEQFMRLYFEHTEFVSDVVDHVRLLNQTGSPLMRMADPLLSHVVERDFRVGLATIWATPAGLQKLRTSPADILRLLEFSILYDKPISQDTWDSIRVAATSRHFAVDARAPLDPEVCRRFLDLLGQTNRVGQTLRMLHRLRVLERIIPAAEHARCLLQFNSFHKYTVDEHSFRAVDELTAFNDDDGPIGDAYRAVAHKRALHLAMLIHDFGKGYEEDHSEVGKRIAEETSARLGLASDEAELVVFLVHRHLYMSQLALRHDIFDDRVIAPFAAMVGTPEKLRMLFVLTCADMKAVGPGALNEWRLQIINDLYKQTLHLFSANSPEEAADERLARLRSEVSRIAQSKPDATWWRKHVEALPPQIILATDPRQIVDELAKLQQLPTGEALAWGRYLPERKAMEYTVGTRESITEGIFHKLTGALASNGQQIFSAEIHTLADGLVLDRFYVDDRDFSGTPPASRIEQLCAALVAALKDSAEARPTFRRVWSAKDRPTAADLVRIPTKVTIENDTSDRYTIVAVFTYDRMGLLYSIARALFESGASIARAKISTNLDQVVDVFYVCDIVTQKQITDVNRINVLRQRLLDEIDQPASES